MGAKTGEKSFVWAVQVSEKLDQPSKFDRTNRRKVG